MNSPRKHMLAAITLGLVGLAVGAAGIHVGDTDDAPGAALLGLVGMLGLVALAVRAFRRKA